MNDIIPSTHFCVSAVPEKDRYDFWRESISCIFQVEPSKETLNTSFNASVDAYMCGQLFFARTNSKEQAFNRRSSEIANDGMDHFMFQIYSDGEMLVEHNDDKFRFGSNQIVVFDLSRDAITNTNNFTNLSLVIPRDLLEPQLLHPDGHHLRILNTDEPMARLLFEHILSLNSIVSDMTISQAAEINPASVALAAAALNGSPNDRNTAAGSPSLAQSIMVKRAIENNLADSELNPETLSRMVGISRSKLYNIFEREGGVAAYLRERRLRKARTMLLRPESSSGTIMEIAYSLGFSNNSAFSRAFKNHYGQSPREIRRSKTHANYASTGNNFLDRRYESWLKDLSC
jgi:AraC-like DNA-binding protein